MLNLLQEIRAQFSDEELDFRLDLALEAVYEASAAASYLARLHDLDAEHDSRELTLFVRAVGRRMYDLSSISMSVLGGDHLRTTQDMHRKLYGVNHERMFAPRREPVPKEWGAKRSEGGAV